jgi:lysine biosynthesis protein LysW
MGAAGKDAEEGTVGTCLECDTNIDIDEDTEIGDIIICPQCKTRLEVIDLAPVVILDYAVDEEDLS